MEYFTEHSSWTYPTTGVVILLLVVAFILLLNYFITGPAHNRDMLAEAQRAIQAKEVTSIDRMGNLTYITSGLGEDLIFASTIEQHAELVACWHAGFPKGAQWV